jgi:hypothetical protein
MNDSNQAALNPEPNRADEIARTERTKQVTVAGYTAGVSAFFGVGAVAVSPTWPTAFGVSAAAIVRTYPASVRRPAAFRRGPPELGVRSSAIFRLKT